MNLEASFEKRLGQLVSAAAALGICKVSGSHTLCHKLFPGGNTPEKPDRQRGLRHFF